MESEVTKENFKELLYALVESHFVKIKVFEPRNCISLTKLDQYSNSNESSYETLASNETLAINANEEFIKFKNSIIEGFDVLKSSFFAEVNSFKNKHLNSYANEVSLNNSERLTRQLLRQYYFLREQLKNRGEIINSLLQQLSKNYVYLFIYLFIYSFELYFMLAK